jgi:hypothetical protein
LLVQFAPLLFSAINANDDDLVPNEGSMLIFWYEVNTPH